MSSSLVSLPSRSASVNHPISPNLSSCQHFMGRCWRFRSMCPIPPQRPYRVWLLSSHYASGYTVVEFRIHLRLLSARPEDRRVLMEPESEDVVGAERAAQILGIGLSTL